MRLWDTSRASPSLVGAPMPPEYFWGRARLQYEPLRQMSWAVSDEDTDTWGEGTEPRGHDRQPLLRANSSDWSNVQSAQPLHRHRPTLARHQGRCASEAGPSPSSPWPTRSGMHAPKGTVGAVGSTLRSGRQWAWLAVGTRFKEELVFAQPLGDWGRWT